MTTLVRRNHSLPFKAFKYTVYLLLSLNVYLFFLDELAAVQHVFRDQFTLANVIEGFAATIDTAAWVLLLLLFELETFVLPDERITGWVKWSLHGVRVLCYGVIVYAFGGYIERLLYFLSYQPLPSLDLCAAAVGWSWPTAVDTYITLDATNCQALAAPAYVGLDNAQTLVAADSYRQTTFLAWVDVINSGTWILVCVLLELDVQAQLRGFTDSVWLRFNHWAKLVIYTVLFAAAVCWGVTGSLLDFWDAFLWLVAFFFIELNVFAWQEETAEQALISA